MTSRPIQVLVVDDDDDVRELLLEILAAEGFRAIAAGNGAEALAAIAELPRPRVMLLDLRMPVMSGWELIESLRRDGRLSEIPIVICTSAPRDAPAGFPVLAKPIGLAEMLDVIARTAA